MTELRERACDWLRLGPIVGHCEADSVRILAQPFAPIAGMLELRVAPAAEHVRFDPERAGFWPVELSASVGAVRSFGPAEHGAHGTVSFELEGLEPDTRYFYEVVPEDAPREIAGSFASRQPFSFRTPPRAPEAFRFALTSCNGVHRPPRGRAPMAMWQRLVSEALGEEDQAPHFALFVGDQIYADEIREQWLRTWDPEIDLRADDEHTQRCRDFLDELPARYELMYQAYWHRSELRTLMGHLPCLMSWDDHDIYDGWGSHGDEALPAQQAFFRAAAGAFDAFATTLHPRASLSADAVHHRQRHRAFSFMLGEAAFVVLDLRSLRDAHARRTSAVLGDEQWRWLEAELEALARRRPRQVFLVSSIPLVHVGAAVELLTPTHHVMHDDVLDHWGSRPNRNDQARLLGNLFQLRKRSGANVVILSGDVHVATVGEIRSEDPRFLLPGEREARLHQCVSSAIASAAPAGIAASVLAWLVRREHPVRGGFCGEVSEIICERNFAIVSAEARGAVRFALYSETNAAPEEFYLADWSELG